MEICSIPVTNPIMEHADAARMDTLLYSQAGFPLRHMCAQVPADRESTGIRFAIMCDRPVLRDWQVQAVKKLLSLERVDLVLLILNESVSNPALKHHRSLVFRGYWLIFARPRATRPVDVRALFSAIPSIHCRTVTSGKHRIRLEEEDLRTIARWNLDFILYFGSSIVSGKALNVARFGLWSFHHGDEQKYRGTPACFWEIYHGDPVTGAILQRLVERLDAGVVLRKGFFRTISYSYRRNIDRVFYESARWPAQVCIDILNGNAGYLDARPSDTSAPILHAPNNLQTFLFAGRLIVQRLRLIYESLFRQSEWNIGVVEEPIHSFLVPGFKPETVWLQSPSQGYYRADPFGLVQNASIRIFFEEFDIRRLKGVIMTAKLENPGTLLQPEEAIVQPYHMSYPYIFEHQGEIYCIPESSRVRELAIYRAKRFPLSWEKLAVLVENSPAVDATIFLHEGTWWLTFTDSDRGAENINLYAWHAPDLTGPWKPHANNPIKTDVRSSRPAGTPFHYGDRLYRPAQDCSRGYGRRIMINEVLRITPSEFQERPVAIVEPILDGPYPDGAHTISAVGEVTLVDGMRLKFVVAESLARSLRRIKEFLKRS